MSLHGVSRDYQGNIKEREKKRNDTTSKFSFRTFTTSQIVHLTLDYNRCILIQDNTMLHCIHYRLTVDSIATICHNLRNSISLISLNLNYCHLTAKCGEPLGSLVTTTQLRFNNSIFKK